MQAFSDCTLKYKYSRSTRAADEVGPLWIEVRDGQGEDAVVVAVQQSDAVRSDECRPVFLAGVEDALFEGCSLGCLLAKAGRDDDEGAHPLLGTEVVDIVGTVLGGHHQYGEVGLWDVLHVVTGLNALNGVLLRVHDAEFALIASAEQITHNRATGLVHVVRAANDDDARRI